MECCGNCDFCEVLPDGALFCALRDEHVHGNHVCSDHQQETRRIDGDEWYEVMTWPTRRRSRNRRS